MRTILPQLALAALLIPSNTQAQLPDVDILLEHDAGNSQLHVKLRANLYDFSELISGFSVTVRWDETSPATLGFGSSAWCVYPNSAFQPSPASSITPGNGYHYRNWTSFGSALLSDLQDNGGCENLLLADSWIEVATIPINGDPGGTVYEVATDQYATDNNLLYFISLRGIDHTGDVYSGTTAAEPVPLTESGFSLAPNPALANTVLTIADPQTAWEVVLTDALGRTVYNHAGKQASTISIDLTGFAPGSYHVKVITAEYTWTRKLVVQRP